MTVYLVILEDRHTDVEVFPHATERGAVERFDRIVARYRRALGEHADDAGLEVSSKPPGGWLRHATLSTEGDAVRVVTAEMGS